MLPIIMCFIPAKGTNSVLIKRLLSLYTKLEPLLALLVKDRFELLRGLIPKELIFDTKDDS